MSMTAWNPESLSSELGREIPEILVVVCKNDVAGLQSEDIARLLGVELKEIQDLQASEDYKDVRLLLGAASAANQVETDGGWDAIEQLAVKKLEKMVKSSADPEFTLKAAMVANKAQRRLRQGQDMVLDPSKGAAAIPLKLTERLIQKLNAAGDLTQIREREISVLNGTAKNPSFSTIDRALGVSSDRQSQIQQRQQPDSFDWEDLGISPPSE